MSDSASFLWGWTHKDGKNLLPLLLFVELNGLLNLHITSSGAEWLFCQRAFIFFGTGNLLTRIARLCPAKSNNRFMMPSILRLHRLSFSYIHIRNLGEHAHFYKYIEQRATILLIWLGCQGCAPSFYSYFNWTHVVRHSIRVSPGARPLAASINIRARAKL